LVDGQERVRVLVLVLVLVTGSLLASGTVVGVARRSLVEG